MEAGHLCHTLRDMLPRLLNLRLRLAYFCPELIPGDQSQPAQEDNPDLNHMEGKTIIINTVGIYKSSGCFILPTSACGSGILGVARTEALAMGSTRHWKDPGFPVSKLLPRIKSAIGRKSLGNLVRFSILDI